MAFVHSLSSVAAEDHQETNEEVDGVVIDSERVGKWIKPLLRLSLMDDSLGVEEGQGASQTKASPEPDVEEGLGCRVDHAHNADSHHAHASHR